MQVKSEWRQKNQGRADSSLKQDKNHVGECERTFPRVPSKVSSQEALAWDPHGFNHATCRKLQCV